MPEINRNYLKSISYLMEHFPVVAILGARQTGKFTLMRMALPDSKHFDLENERDLARVETDAQFFLSQAAGAPIGISASYPW